MSSNSLLSTTLPIILKNVVDQTFLAHPLLNALDKAGAIKRHAGGGDRVKAPVMLDEAGVISDLGAAGRNAVDLTFKDPLLAAEFTAAHAAVPVQISGVEKSYNRGPEAMVNILQSRTQNAILQLRKELCKQFFRGNSTKMSSWETLNGMTTSPGTGWLEGVARASQDAVVGGISKATYQSTGWYNPFVDAGGTLSLDELNKLFNECMVNHPGGEQPDMLFLSVNAYTALEKLLTVQTRYSDVEQRNGMTKPVLQYRGASVFIEPTLGYTAEAPAKAVSGFALSSKFIELHVAEDRYFSVGELMLQPGTDIEIANVALSGQFVCNHLGSQGVLLDAEA